jgi:hypothetical protein
LTFGDELIDDTLRGAAISEDEVYRYTLWRQWGTGQPMVFVMLNPSTADAEQDDPTIRRCVSFAKREGYGGIHVVNLFAYRATDPADLLRCPVDVVGPENDYHIREAGRMARLGGKVVAAWGAHATATSLRVNAVRMALRAPIYCLGLTKQGAPRHPLYVRGDAPLISYAERYLGWGDDV